MSAACTATWRLLREARMNSASGHTCSTRSSHGRTTAAGYQPLFYSASHVLRIEGRTCTARYRSVSRVRQKSPDILVSIPTELSEGPNLAMSQDFYGHHQIQPRNLRALQTPAFAQPNDGFQVSLLRLTRSSKPRCTKHSSETENVRPASLPRSGCRRRLIDSPRLAASAN